MPMGMARFIVLLIGMLAGNVLSDIFIRFSSGLLILLHNMGNLDWNNH